MIEVSDRPMKRENHVQNHDPSECFYFLLAIDLQETIPHCSPSPSLDRIAHLGDLTVYATTKVEEEELGMGRALACTFQGLRVDIHAFEDDVADVA